MPSVTFTSTGTWTCPPWVTVAQVACTGGGGGNTDGASPGGAGGGEFAYEPSLAVTPNKTYTVTVGAGGPAGGAGTPGTDGGTSSFAGDAVTVTAHGGTGEAINTIAGAAGGTGSSNTFHYDGGTGGLGYYGTGSPPLGGGGGGASASASGAGGNGGNASATAGGAAGVAPYGGGDGGAGAFAATAGAVNGGAGSAPGGGGGAPADGGAGGAGAAGQVVITYPSSPSPAVPQFIAGTALHQSSMASLWADPAMFFLGRVVFRAVQSTTATSLPASGSQVKIAYDDVLEDPYSGWNASTYEWTPPSGYSGWYHVTVGVWVVNPPAEEISVTARVVLPNALTSAYTVGTVVIPEAVSGVQGSWYVYLAGGSDPVYGAGLITNASAALDTSLTAGQQSSLEIMWVST